MDKNEKNLGHSDLAKRIVRHSSIYFLIMIFAILTMGCIGGEPVQDVSDTSQSGLNNSGVIITENIERTLVGHQIVYYDIAGEPRYYNISKKDINDIEKSESDGETIWIATVGHGMQWEIHLNSTGELILEETQLFRT